MSPAKGFTLIEILVVVVLIAITASLGVAALRPAQPSLSESAGRLASRLERLALEARLSGRKTALRCDGRRLQFEMFRQGENLGEGQWEDWKGVTEWLPPTGATLTFSLGGIPFDCQKRIIYPAYGTNPALTLRMGSGRGEAISIIGNEAGAFRLDTELKN